jgi:hypothetical protein
MQEAFSISWLARNLLTQRAALDAIETQIVTLGGVLLKVTHQPSYRLVHVQRD